MPRLAPLILALLLGLLSTAQAGCVPQCRNGGVCTLDDSGNPFCLCDETGFRGSHCQIPLICPETSEDNAFWPSTRANRISIGRCDDGFLGVPRRRCLFNGVFGEPLQSFRCWNASLTCPEEHYGHATFPAAAIDTVVAGVCDEGFVGSPIRRCLVGPGVWASNLLGSCSPISCPATFEGNAYWKSTAALAPASGKCDDGLGGTVSRECQADGTWGPITGSCALCTGETYARATFTDTASRSLSFGKCLPGFKEAADGPPTRRCLEGGVWSTHVRNLCHRIVCPASDDNNAAWPEVSAGAWMHGECHENFQGDPTRQCLLDGSLGTIVHPCVPIPVFCPAEADTITSWTKTIGGATSTGRCLFGYTGSPVRQCNPDGTWDNIISSPCQAITCPAFVTATGISFPATNAGDTVNGSCPESTIPDPIPTATCTLDGTWTNLAGGCDLFMKK